MACEHASVEQTSDATRYLGLLQLPAELLHLDALDFVRCMKLLPLLLNVRVRLLPLLDLQFGIDEVLTHLLQVLCVLCLRTLQAPLTLLVVRGHAFVGVHIQLAEGRALLLCRRFGRGGAKCGWAGGHFSDRVLVALGVRCRDLLYFAVGQRGKQLMAAACAADAELVATGA